MEADIFAEKVRDVVKSYILPVVVEPDAEAWRAHVPALEAKGVASWDTTADEAFRNMEEIAKMVLASLLEDGEPLPPDGNATVSSTPFHSTFTKTVASYPCL